MTSDTPHALRARFLSADGRPIRLFEGPARLRSNGQSTEWRCVIDYEWTPYEGPSVHLSSETAFQSTGEEAELEFVCNGMAALSRVYFTQQDISSSPSTGTTFAVSAILAEPLWIGKRDECVSSLTFQVPCFPRLFGECISRKPEKPNFIEHGRMRFQDEDWEITLDSIEDPPSNRRHDSLFERAKRNRTFALTHVGRLIRKDNALFTWRDAEPVIRDFERSLSFARAAPVCAILISGHSANGEVTWEKWDKNGNRVAAALENWFYPMQPEILKSVFQGFRTLQDQERERNHVALHLYTDAHTPGLAMESRTVLMQTGLELLAKEWQHNSRLQNALPQPSLPIEMRQTVSDNLPSRASKQLACREA
jgi:hypothetical protein